MKKINVKTIENLKKLGANIQNVRITKNITLQELSEKTRIRKKYLQKIEKGEAIGILISHVLKIAKALDVKVSLLVK